MRTTSRNPPINASFRYFAAAAGPDGCNGGRCDRSRYRATRRRVGGDGVIADGSFGFIDVCVVNARSVGVCPRECASVGSPPLIGNASPNRCNRHQLRSRSATEPPSQQQQGDCASETHYDGGRFGDNKAGEDVADHNIRLSARVRVEAKGK